MANTAETFTGGFSGIDDQERVAIGNGTATVGAAVARLIAALTAVANGGRMLRTFWGGTGLTNKTNVRRSVLPHTHVPGAVVDTVILALPPVGARVSGQGVRTVIDDTGGGSVTSDFYADYDYEGFTGANVPVAPSGVVALRSSQDVSTMSSSVYSISLGSLTANGPGLISGMIYEEAQQTADAAVPRFYTPHEHAQGGSDIVGIAPGSSDNHVGTFFQNFLHTWARKRPSIAWDVEDSGSGTNYVEFSTSSQAFRFIHKQTIGDGGTAPSKTGPAVTFPLALSASGIKTTVPVAVWVYAAMSGTTDTGSIGISHVDLDGLSMTAITGMSGIIISGTTFKWYRTLYDGQVTFDGRADIVFERILLCAKSGGATDKVRIAAYQMTVWPSQSIT